VAVALKESESAELVAFILQLFSRAWFMPHRHAPKKKLTTFRLFVRPSVAIACVFSFAGVAYRV